MNNFFNQAGKFALGSRLRILGEKLMEGAEDIYAMYEVDLKPKWFPVFFVVESEKEKSITEIAEIIGHSHPSVSKIVREMIKDGIVTEKKDEADKRRTVITITERGKQIAEKFKTQCEDVDTAVEGILDHTNHDIWKALDEFEYLLNEKSLYHRVKAAKKAKEQKKVQIVPFEPKYKVAFRDLNAEWINTYFKMEEGDYYTLDHPNENILAKGGYIFVAIYENEPLGVCALAKMNDPDYEYELVKMAVSPKAQGKGIGYLLGQAIIDKARALGAPKLYLESNTILKPAINLYKKLGFVKVSGRPSPYERCNIQMELDL